jgi:hypothetical protein
MKPSLYIGLIPLIILFAKSTTAQAQQSTKPKDLAEITPTGEIYEKAKAKLFTLPLFHGVPKESIKFDTAISVSKDSGETQYDFILTRPVKIGDISYEPGTIFLGDGTNTFAIIFKGQKKVNRISACEYLIQHGESKKISQFKNCKDLHLPEGIIPKDSHISFRGDPPKGAAQLLNISCVALKSPTVLLGKEISGKVKIYTNPLRLHFPDQEKGCLGNPPPR